jgi:hypothetical protein
MVMVDGEEGSGGGGGKKRRQQKGKRSGTHLYPAVVNEIGDVCKSLVSLCECRRSSTEIFAYSNPSCDLPIPGIP